MTPDELRKEAKALRWSAEWNKGMEKDADVADVLDAAADAWEAENREWEDAISEWKEMEPDLRKQLFASEKARQRAEEALLWYAQCGHLAFDGGARARAIVAPLGLAPDDSGGASRASSPGGLDGHGNYYLNHHDIERLTKGIPK